MAATVICIDINKWIIDINKIIIDIIKWIIDIYNSIIDLNKDGCRPHLYWYQSMNYWYK